MNLSRTLPTYSILLTAVVVAWANPPSGSGLSASPQGSAKTVIHERVEAMLASEKGRVLFSEIWSDQDLSREARVYAARLYEVFFRLPARIETVRQSDGRLPSCRELAQAFGLEEDSAALLLRVLEAEPRLPRMVELDPEGELQSVDAAKLQAFIEQNSVPVRVSDWQGVSFPSLDLKNPFSGSHGLQAGKPRLVWLWVTRCPVCRRLAPSIVELEREFSSSELQIVGYNADAVLGLQPDDAERSQYAREEGMAFPNYLLDRANWEAMGGVNIFPSVFLLDAQGRVEQLLLNVNDPQALVEKVRRWMR
ncbi:MAG TPA: TlpA disulfide reductase family protein [Acidobacteriota bacterium]|nr:TlpA disulfide reductase family protein [Acidobacteriota bacterium]